MNKRYASLDFRQHFDSGLFGKPEIFPGIMGFRTVHTSNLKRQDTSQPTLTITNAYEKSLTVSIGIHAPDNWSGTGTKLQHLQFNHLDLFREFLRQRWKRRQLQQ
jgi:hypothetical protein